MVTPPIAIPTTSPVDIPDELKVSGGREFDDDGGGGDLEVPGGVADYDSAEVGPRNWTVEGETTKYLEMAAALWSLVEEARETSMELESSAKAKKRSALLEGAEKMLVVEMLQAAVDWTKV
ncbi:hypothetical protein Acr_16g0000990 [Actinidia rufa]|uniref:Uncharacterized protein n=1 Tax=Actinidia rufa TaxID=165716 RepID=A0A7J0FXR6_9ERIC|nr:hypothetical protein Acr_16g0000990 [Actinidia rufa]